MKRPTAAKALFMSFGAAVAQDYNAPPPDLSTLPSLSLFDTWRPHIHVLPPAGQIGDPCAHYVDPETGLFHVGYLHNGTGIASVKTDDLVHYYDVNENGNYSIVAGGPNDPLAVFDGSVIPNGVDGKPTLLYTGVSALPIHWTLPYTRGSEAQSLAVTYDGGKNFTKLEIPPVIPEPPAGLDVTSFRDPFVFKNGELDQALNSDNGTWYTTISGGIHDVGPGIFLYRNLSPRTFTEWEYAGEWLNAPANSTWGNGDWSKVNGYNWETANAFSLDREGYNFNGKTFVTFGVEGSYVPIQESVSSMHAMLWASSGGVSATQDVDAVFNPDMFGVLDWGLSAYAGSGKFVPSTSKPSSGSGAPDRFISYIWLTGDVFGGVVGFPAEQQGWQNTLLLPRELYVKDIPNVVNNYLVQEIGSWRVANNSGRCVELETLGIDIARETYDAITNAPGFDEPNRTVTSEGVIPFDRSPESRFFSLEARISFPVSARDSGLQSGFQILASEEESTTIYYQFSNESIIINRYNTSAAAETTSGIDASSEAGRLRLFDIDDSCASTGSNGDKDKGHHDQGHGGKFKHNKEPAPHSKERKRQPSKPRRKPIEALDLTITVDNSVLEVYANRRFALSTYVRPWYANSTEIRFFHNGKGRVSFSNIRVTDGLYDAYPNRAR